MIVFKAEFIPFSKKCALPFTIVFTIFLSFSIPDIIKPFFAPTIEKVNPTYPIPTTPIFFIQCPQ